MLARPPTSLASHLSPNTLLGVDDPRGVPRLPAGRGDAQHPPGLATGESPLPFRARRSCRPVGFEPPLAATCRYLGPTLSCPPPPRPGPHTSPGGRRLRPVPARPHRASHRPAGRSQELSSWLTCCFLRKLQEFVLESSLGGG